MSWTAMQENAFRALLHEHEEGNNRGLQDSLEWVKDNYILTQKEAIQVVAQTRRVCPNQGSFLCSNAEECRRWSNWMRRET